MVIDFVNLFKSIDHFIIEFRSILSLFIKHLTLLILFMILLFFVNLFIQYSTIVIIKFTPFL